LLKQEKIIKDFHISTCQTSKTTGLGNRTSGMFLPSTPKS